VFGFENSNNGFGGPTHGFGGQNNFDQPPPSPFNNFGGSQFDFGAMPSPNKPFGGFGVNNQFQAPGHMNPAQCIFTNNLIAQHTAQMLRKGDMFKQNPFCNTFEGLQWQNSDPAALPMFN